MNSACRPTRSAILGLLLLAAAAIPMSGQTCGVPEGSQTTALPPYSGTLKPDSISTASGNNYVYVMTQFGFARASIAPGSELSPASVNQLIIGKEAGSSSGGLIPMNCDCHTGGTAYDVAESPDGSSRMFSDFNNNSSSTTLLYAEVARTDGSGMIGFGNQVNTPPHGVAGRPAVIYIASTNKFYGYFSNSAESVQIYDLTNTTGSTSTSLPPALSKIGNFGWNAPASLRADHLVAPGIDRYVLAGYAGGAIRVGEISPSSGIPTETASITASFPPTSLFWGLVNGRIFLAAAFPYDRNFNPIPTLRFYEYAAGSLLPVTNGTLAGNFDNVRFRGNGSIPFPAIFTHRVVTPGVEGYIDVYDTKFLTLGGTPQLAISLRHEGASDLYDKNSFDAVVRTSGPAVIAYLYRIVLVPASPTYIPSIHADKIDISCIAADPTAPPVGNAIATNVSAGTRLDKKNYYGDVWTFTDASSSFLQLTNLKFKYNYTTAFNPPTDVDTTPPAAPAHWTSGNVYWPCDPSNGGNIATGASCWTSVGGGTSGSYKFALKTSNGNPDPTNAGQYISAGVAVQAPQVYIGGAPFTSGGTVNVLTGGQVDASATQGNINDPATTFTWVFSPGGTLTGKIVNVPTGATTFTLTVAYPGYSTMVSGSINQTDLVPAFTLSPNPVLTSGLLTLTNTMLKAASATLNSLDYAIDTTPNPSGAFTNGWLTCPGSGFCAIGGTATVAPTKPVGNYYLHVRYNFTGIGGSKSLVASMAFAVTDFAPNPAPLVASNSTGTTLACAFIPCALKTSTTYYLFDGETIPAGVTHPDSSWSFVNGTTTSIGTATASAGPVTWTTPSSACATCKLQLTVGGVTANLALSISAPPPPPPPGGGAPSVSLSGPSTATAGQSVTFTATASGGSGGYTFSWNWGENPLGGLSPGPATNTHTYTNPGSYSVVVQVSSAGRTGSATATIMIAPSGPPPPSAGSSVTGATPNPITGVYSALTGQTITFTATEVHAVSWVWNFGDGATASGASVSHAYSTAGARNVTLTVTGDGTNTATGPTVGHVSVNITVPPFRAAIVPGVAKLDDGMTTWGTDVSIANGGAAPMTISLGWYPLLASGAPDSTDPRNLTYGAPISLEPGGSWSQDDIVSNWVTTGPGLPGNKGTLVIKYDGGTTPPLISTRVRFAPKDNPGNVSYGSGLPAYDVDGSGGIKPQGFTSVVLDSEAGKVQTLSAEAVAGTITVNMTGTGSGTVTSSPAGISCPTTCSASFTGTVTLMGAAAAGSVFEGITGCSQIVLGQCVMNGAGTVTAKFDLASGGGGGGGGNQTLTVTPAGSGAGTVTSSPAGISCPTICSYSFATGTTVILSATPGSGATFAGWGGACSGASACTVTMSGAQSVSATFTPTASAPALDQVLIGLRSNPDYRFGVTLFNSGDTTGTFQLSATDESGAGVLIPDAGGTLVGHRDFTIAPFQQVYLRDPDLGLTDPNHHYVLKATRTSTTGTLLAFGTALDRRTNDLVQITDDSQASAPDPTTGNVSYWIAGVSRYDSSYGAHWRTDLRIFNRGSSPRNVYFDYTFSKDGRTEHVARIGDPGGPSYVTIQPGQLLTYDDLVTSLMSQDTRVDLSGSSAGILRIYYPADSESSSKPLILGARNYDDQPTGTAGTQLAIYTTAQAATDGQTLVLAGAEDSARYATRIGIFTTDAGPVNGAITAVAPDGSIVGTMGFSVGGGGLHYGQIDLTQLNGFSNPGHPVTIKVQASGGRISSYAFTVDKVTLDTNLIQGLPQ